jgi:peptidoglycan/xylan/chitin deacetylase (PgdA/CDA1 family)
MEVNIILNFQKKDERRVKYIFDFIFNTLGLDFSFSEKEKEGSFNIYFGADNQRGASINLIVPYHPYRPWQQKKPKIIWKEELPLLYINNKPTYLIRGNRIGFDLINSIFFLLSRQEEIGAERDEWDCFSEDKSLVVENNLLSKPIIDYYLNFLKRLIKNWSIENRKDFNPKPFWPEKKEFAVALTHDVDQIDFLNFRKVLYGLGYAVRNSGRGLGEVFRESKRIIKKKSNLVHFDKIINLENQFGLKSTFYFSGQDRYFYNQYDLIYKLSDQVLFRGKKITLAELIQYLNSTGWEIGLHGSYESCRNYQVLLKEKENLEKVLNDKVFGVRQHFLHFDSQKTWSIQSKAGFKYDSSLGFNRYSGWRAGISIPFYPYNLKEEKKENILEFPLAIMDASLFFFQKLKPEKAFERCKEIIEEAQKLNGLVILLWHSHIFNEILYPGWLDVYESVLGYLKSKNAFVGSIKEILNWRSTL